jgi:hypothetical protein
MGPGLERATMPFGGQNSAALAGLPRAAAKPRSGFDPFFAHEAHVNLRVLRDSPQGCGNDEPCGQGLPTDHSFITILARFDGPDLAARPRGTCLVTFGTVMKRGSPSVLIRPTAWPELALTTRKERERGLTCPRSSATLAETPAGLVRLRCLERFGENSAGATPSRARPGAPERPGGRRTRILR